MNAPLELSRRLPVERIARTGTEFVVEANQVECAAVALRLMIPAIAALRCKWDLRPGEAGMIEAHGALRAALTQDCVVTLEPFDGVLQDVFEVHFVLEGRESEEDDPEEPDQLVYDGVAIDLGEATVEQLALALDPYPRKPDATLPDLGANDAGGAFDALAKLRDLD
jgi:hypothetical protein